jgi:flagella basal body P-ring formation protein FlgA
MRKIALVTGILLISLKIAAAGPDAGGSTGGEVPAAGVVTGREIMEMCKEYILRNMPWEKEDVVLEAGRLPEDVKVYDMRMPVEIVPNKAFLDYGGVMLFKARVHLGGNEFMGVPVSVTVRRFSEVMVARRQINPDELVGENDFTFKREEVTSLSKDALVPGDNIAGMKSKTMILPGQVLCSRMFRALPLVKNRDLVTVVLESPGLTIRTKAMALKDGYRGDVIRVLNIDSKKEILTEVVTTSLVRVVR